MIFSALALVLAVIPFHGTVLGSVNPHTLVVSNEAIPATLSSGTRTYRVERPLDVHSGTGIDGLLDRSTSPWTLRSATVAAAFSPGAPEPGRVIAVDIGRPIPDATLVDQNERLVHLASAYAGKTILLSFIFTRCPDKTLCPAISGKFAYMQSHLDPQKFALIEVTLDPQYDSPAILREYAATYGTNSNIWHLLTGTGSTLQHLLNQFGINSLRVSSANFIHNDKLFIVAPTGAVAFSAETGGWDPDGAIAEAQSIAGLAGNPFERAKLSLIAGVVALCGGSQFAGIVLLELALFFVISIFVTAGLWVVGRVLWKNG
ncbi:MAG: SCO family protein [Candidatus Baltobacteraceae bacterium]